MDPDEVTDYLVEKNQTFRSPVAVADVDNDAVVVVGGENGNSNSPALTPVDTTDQLAGAADAGFQVETVEWQHGFLVTNAPVPVPHQVSDLDIKTSSGKFHVHERIAHRNGKGNLFYCLFQYDHLHCTCCYIVQLEIVH